MPPPGWYADPEQAWTWRWWDGSRWTDLRAPQTTGPLRDPYSFGRWFEESFELCKRAIAHVGVMVGLAWVSVGALAWMAAVVVFTGSKGRELRDLLDLDEVFASGESRVELTAAESDRLRDVVGDLFWSSLPWMAALALIGALVSLWTTAVTAIGAHHVDFDDDLDRTDDAAAAVRRSPVVFASVVLVGAAIGAALVLAAVPFVLALVLDAPGGVIAVTGVFGALAAIAVTWWLWVRMALAPPLAAIGGHGTGLARSWELTHGHAWGVAGRLLIAGLIAGAVTIPLNFLNLFGVSVGFLGSLAVLAVFQVAGLIATTLVTIPAQVVLIRHLTEQHAVPLG
jgi:hypothetical protein